MRQPFSFWLAAHSSKGHGVHSPLVYSFCREVLRSKWDGNRQEPMSLRSTILAWFLGYCSSCGYECCVFSEYSLVGHGLRIAIAYVHSDTQGWHARAKSSLSTGVRASASEGVGGRPLRLRFAARHPGIAGGIYCRTGVAADAVCNEGRLAEWAAG